MLTMSTVAVVEVLRKVLPGVVERNLAGASDMLRGRLQSNKASPYFQQVKLGMVAKIEAGIVRLVSSSQPTINFCSGSQYSVQCSYVRMHCICVCIIWPILCTTVFVIAKQPQGTHSHVRT